ncbi:MAG: VWA-like domain-containing protein [Actinobacteria bacterium]|nr:VWA-like domain-containing protein [Actinomycetota bacterium]
MAAQADVLEAAQLRLMAARIVAQGRWPYLSTLLFSLRLVPMSAEVVPTMAVDAGWRMYYNPEFIVAESVDALATVLLHEAMHCVLSHAVRYDAIDSGDGSRDVWNIAGDCSINETLDEARMPWTRSVTPLRISQYVKQGLTPGMTTEAMYLKLMEKESGVGTLLSRRGQKVPDCGSAADRIAREYELAPDDDDAPAAGRGQQETVIDRVASEVLASSRNAGSVPAGLLRWAQEHLDPKLDWRRILGVRLRRAVASVAGRRDYTYSRPSRRQGAMRQQGLSVVLPAMRQPAPPRVAIVVDTSGSISSLELRQYIGEVAGIVRAVGVSQGVWVIPCDSAAGRVQRLRSVASVDSLELTGGGGTDMGAGIKAALLIRPTPQVVVVVTDGYTPWPAEKPRGLEHGIVVLSEDSQQKDVPEWLDSLVID